MSNKVFAFLVILLVSLIIASIVGLILSINRYTEARFPDHKPSVLTEVPLGKTESKPTTNITETNTNTNTDTNTTQTSPSTTTQKEESKYILPSDTKEIREIDLVGMDKDTLNKAYNEIFARHGHEFKTASLKEYFEKQSWYKAIAGKTVLISELSELENKNLTTIKARIDKIK